MAETEKMDISYMGPIFKKYRVDANRTQEEVAEKWEYRPLPYGFREQGKASKHRYSFASVYATERP